MASDREALRAAWQALWQAYEGVFQADDRAHSDQQLEDAMRALLVLLPPVPSDEALEELAAAQQRMDAYLARNGVAPRARATSAMTPADAESLLRRFGNGRGAWLTGQGAPHTGMTHIEVPVVPQHDEPPDAWLAEYEAEFKADRAYWARALVDCEAEIVVTTERLAELRQQLADARADAIKARPLTAEERAQRFREMDALLAEEGLAEEDLPRVPYFEVVPDEESDG